MKITKHQLRNVIKKALLKEELLKIISNSYEPQTELYNKIVNYAINNDIKGAIADPEVNTPDLDMDIEETLSWVGDVGKPDYMDADAVVPENWDADAVFDWLDDLRKAWYQDRQKGHDAAVAADPDSDWLEFISFWFSGQIVPDDLKSLGWKAYKNYIRLAPPESMEHAVGETNVPNKDFSKGNSPGTRDEFIEFLEDRAGYTLGKRKPVKYTPPLYD